MVEPSATMKTILVIEDDPSLQQALADKLTSENYRVLAALNAKIGWTLTVREHPDLILLDIMLPGGMNGFDFLEQLEKDPRLSPIPVVVLTNLDSEEKVSRKIGAADYFVKSDTPMEKIASRIHEILAPVSTA